MANCKVIAVANQKGGVGKSTSVYCIGAGLAMDGKRVLLVDVDPQGDLTKMLGQRKPHELPHTLSEQMNAVVQNKTEPEHPEILHHHEGFDFVPANRSLSAVEVGLVNVMSRETVLKRYLDGIKQDYDYVLLDCRPSLGMLVINALSAADQVLIPVQADYLAAEVEKAARMRMELMMPELARNAGATEELKAADPLAWAGLMNACKEQAEEIILTELIYC